MTAHALRAADPSEFDALVRLWMTGWDEAHRPIMPPAFVRLRTPEDFQARMRRIYGALRVIGPVGEPLGFHSVQGDELDQLYVSAQARGAGVAATLLADAEARIAAGGHTIAWLACAIGNERAARFYEKHGWRRTGVVTHRPDTPAGPFALDVWRYEKRVG